MLIDVLPEEARFVLGDTHYDDNDLKESCLLDGRFLITPRRGPYPHTDPGVEVRRIFHLLRYRAIAYAARWGGVRTTNIALFVERCREDLEPDSFGRLGEPMLEDLVLEAADRYKLIIAFLGQ